MNNEQSPFSVKDLRVLVTGSTRGIGRAIGENFARLGATVVFTGRNGDTAKRVAEETSAACRGYALDVASEASVKDTAEQIFRDIGGIDVLINNAGIDPHYASMEKTSTASWSEILRTNLDGVFYCCKYFTTTMLADKKGSIINISSVAGKVGLKRQVPYCASKGGVEQITRALALDWAENGIRVNGIGYGFIETDLTAGMTEHAHIAPRLLARTPMARFGKVDEVAGAAIFLSSASASFITGHTIMVDGGWMAA